MIPIAPKSEPATEIPEIVIGAVPEEVSVTDCLPMLPTGTFPNDTDDALTLRAATPVAGDSATEKVSVTPPSSAVIVAVCGVATAAMVALKLLLDAPALTVVELGTVTAGLLLLRTTEVFTVAFEVRCTEHVSVPGALYALLLHETLLRTGDPEAAIDETSRKRSVRILEKFWKDGLELRFQ